MDYLPKLAAALPGTDPERREKITNMPLPQHTPDPQKKPALQETAPAYLSYK